MLCETDPLPTRWSLIRKIKNPEDQDSWATFFGLYRGLILRVAIRSGLAGVEAQEVVQDTFLAVHHNIARFDADPAAGSFKGWLLRLTQWRIADQFRKRPTTVAVNRQARVDGDPETSTAERVADPRSQFESIWDSEWKQTLLTLALQNLKQQVDAEQFQLFDFYALRHWPLAKVTRLMRVNVGQVYLAKHRVSKLLKKEVRRLEGQME